MSDSEGRQFVDTNVFVYAYDRQNEAKQRLARELLKQLWENRRGCVSIQVLQELYVTMTKKVAVPLQPGVVAGIISDLSTWNCHKPDVNDILDAISVQQRYKTSFWDAMILNSARKMGCRVLWSENFNTGQVYEEVLVLNPFDSENSGRYK